MSILIDIRADDWMTEEQLESFLQPLLPGVSMHCRDAGEQKADVTMIATAQLRPGILSEYPNVRLIQKLGAGVDAIVSDSDVNRKNIRVCRLKPDMPAHEIAEYCLTYVLHFQRQVAHYDQAQKNGLWKPLPPMKASETTVCVLGLGHIGARTADYFAHMGYRVIGWSRSQKHLPDVDCRAGEDALSDVLATGDYVVSILPSTELTRNLINSETLSGMKSSAVLINAGRGDLVNQEDLLEALDQGTIKAAVLDVFQQEPVPADHPLWTHPNVIMTPHVSGWHLDDGLDVVAKNYLALINNQPLAHEVDIHAGY
ncbi:MAG: glyoxylate/hydroxypyruvate reductase A [Pseudomonadota bacterium]